jgi:hypothetical protein
MPLARSRRHPLASSWRGRSLSLLLVLALPAFAAAASPRDELLRYVADDVGFCLLVQDLRGHSAALANSPFAEAWASTPLGKAVRGSEEVAQLLKQEDELRKSFGLDWAKLRDDLLGDALVFAYRPGPPGKPEEEQGLLLLRAHDAKPLADLIERLNKTASEVEERTHNGVVYHRRVERKETIFYHVNGPILLVTGKEDVLKQALDLNRKADREAEPPLARQLRRLGVETALLAVWINPRAFDADLKDKVEKARGAEATALKQFAVYWKALEGIALAVHLEKDLRLSLALRARLDELPEAARRYLAESARPSELWKSFPDNAMLAVAGRFDAGSFVEVIGGFLTDGAKRSFYADLDGKLKALGKDSFREVLPYLGPDWGLCILAPAATDKNWFPLGVLALRVAQGDPSAPVDKALLRALDSAAALLTIAHNSSHPDQPLKLLTLMQDKREVSYLTSDRLASGLRPAYGLAAGKLLLATSPETLARFAAPGTQSLPDPSEAVPLLRLSLKDLRTYLKERREVFVGVLVEQNQWKPAEARQRLDDLIANLQLLDRVEVRQRTSPGQATLSIVVQTALPLKK